VVDVVAEGGQRLERLAMQAREPEVRHALQEALRFPPLPDSDSPLSQPLRTGRSLLVSEVSEAWLERTALNAEHRRLLDVLRPRSAMMVPLVARGRTLGVLSAASQHATRRYDERDLAALEDLAWRAALAADNALLFQRAEGAVAARDEFVAIATHELRTPLSALHLQLTSLHRALQRGAPPPPERLEQSLTTALRQTDRLGGLVTHLFDVSRVSTGQLELEREAVDLSALVHRLVARFEEPLAQARSAAVVEAERPVVARVDRLRVEQVLMNLLSNAMKYAPGQPVELTVEQVGGDAVVAVKDSGPGIPAEQQARIFERFQRASGEHSRSSLGLGLYISRQIARAHGGDLTVESTPGQGARFLLRLPREPG
jgi:signal transduction histidine kinase